MAKEIRALIKANKISDIIIFAFLSVLCLKGWLTLPLLNGNKTENKLTLTQREFINITEILY